jgi:hypothetical protein
MPNDPVRYSDVLKRTIQEDREVGEKEIDGSSNGTAGAVN